MFNRKGIVTVLTLHLKLRNTKLLFTKNRVSTLTLITPANILILKKDLNFINLLITQTLSPADYRKPYALV